MDQTSRVLTHGISGGYGGEVGAVLAVVATVAAVASAATAAYGSYKAGQTSKEVGEYNAKLAEQQARQTQQAAAYQAAQQRRRAQQLIAAQHAAYGASGVTAEGSPLDVMTTTAQELERDALAIRWGGQAKGAALEAEAMLQKYKGKQAALAGNIGAGSTLLSGLSSAAASGYNYYRTPRVNAGGGAGPSVYEQLYGNP